MQTKTHIKQGKLDEKLENILYKVNKPSRYIGNEPGSANKDWDTAEARLALAFPDLYEIGISNMGLRILYDRINHYSEQNFLADRVYAPETDFREQLIQNNIPLYGVESHRSLKDFDIIAFSLQYELSYPTLLSMLEMAGIPYRREDRTASDPLIIAGGPGAYNPGPMEDFVDAFIFGDGETVIIDILNNIKDREKIAELEGVYMPGYFKGSKIKKRIENIDNKNYPVNFPVPFSSSVHDRAVVEIRRGCNRMCRFCQACFVNFPVRERSQGNIIHLIDESLRNTGYEEYSLLSLSSNDYSGIIELVRTLNEKHAKTGASVSLPSQRADNFSLELAEMVQAVRKSTITLAAEAGSQRLRNVINKNLTEEQIIDAVTAVAKAGWRNVKLYFMIGLPTETKEDLDAMYELLKKIKYSAGKITITCSVSIFVPKTFTPFQWFGQEKTEAIYEKIRYLKAKTKTLRGVKVNVHDVFLCQLEAVFSRGDQKLAKLIETAYKKGSYLDAWKEHFNRQLWLDAAQECGINLEEYSTKTFNIDEELPWDMLDIGIEKDFLKKEYEKALAGECHSSQNSQTQQNTTSEKTTRQTQHGVKVFSETGYKYRMKVSKTGYLKFISHLDWQKLIYTAIRKSGMKINYSQGFNPAPKISIGVALPLFIEGKNEYIDIELQEEIAENIIKEKLNNILPENSQISKIVKIPKNNQSIEKEVQWAVYRAYPQEISTNEKNNIESIAKEFLLKENIIIEKTSKKGVKQVDIRPLVHLLSFDKEKNILEFIISSFRADEFVKILSPETNWKITREKMLDCNFKELI
jgi:radical SAM family uncharacterized protein/radical SAM-linked protein